MLNGAEEKIFGGAGGVPLPQSLLALPKVVLCYCFWQKAVDGNGKVMLY